MDDLEFVRYTVNEGIIEDLKSERLVDSDLRRDEEEEILYKEKEEEELKEEKKEEDGIFKRVIKILILLFIGYLMVRFILGAWIALFLFLFISAFFISLYLSD